MLSLKKLRRIIIGRKIKYKAKGRKRDECRIKSNASSRKQNQDKNTDINIFL